MGRSGKHRKQVLEKRQILTELDIYKRRCHPFFVSGKGEKTDLTHTWNTKDGQDGGNDHYREACKIKESAFYLYKAVWSKEPFVHICGRGYVKKNRGSRKDKGIFKSSVRKYLPHKAALLQCGPLQVCLIEILIFAVIIKP